MEETTDLAAYLSDLADVADLIALADAEPLAAADVLDAWIEQFRAVSRCLREQAPRPGIVSEGGFGDRVCARVIGPDGSLRGTGGAN